MAHSFFQFTPLYGRGQKDNCLLSFEFKELIDSITDIITGKETGLIQTFMEPYFSFAVTQIGEEYAVQIRFVYDTSDNWKTVYVCQKMMLDELTGLRDAFKALYDQYPYRKVKEE